ncbi:type VI secretion system baseplate subunit TssK [Sphingomonas sp. PAMC 26605]|uniref:type VI secretion system baseplate subunit TssK n=1 Tax=Sphingomonas sp. PAMC 26605 TaxID=1112214 RepID=UPI00026CA72B|nr:type VI secretion system baseplate subunit TssK [Sphingomonas sp. PAMC 26605]
MLGEGRVAWREGLFLRQQHFQQQDRAFAALIGAQARVARPYPWGVTDAPVPSPAGAEAGA